MSDVIRLDGIQQAFGRNRVLADVNLVLRRGEVLGLLGANGSGKSTLLRIVAGIDRPHAGSVELCTDDGGRTLRVGALLDPAWLDDRLTCHQHLAIAFRYAEPRSQTGAVRDALERVGLSGAGRRRVKHLSLGMRQRLALALALVDEPDVLVLDEPLNGLDPEGVLWMRELLTDFARSGGSVLLSSHLMAEMERIAHRVVLLSDGAVTALGTGAAPPDAGVRVRASSGAEELRRRMEASGATVRVGLDGEMTVHGLSPAQVFTVAAAAGAVLTHLVRDAQTLEAKYRAASARRK